MDKFNKRFNRTKNTFWAVFIVNAIVGVGIIGALAYVAIHFLRKFW